MGLQRTGTSGRGGRSPDWCPPGVHRYWGLLGQKNARMGVVLVGVPAGGVEVIVIGMTQQPEYVCLV